MNGDMAGTVVHWRGPAHLHGSLPPLWPTAVMWERGLSCPELPISQEKSEMCILGCNALSF